MWLRAVPPLLFAASLWAQISPGPLSQAHSAFEGPLKCANCHTFGAGAPTFKCAGCHGEIQIRLKEKRGFHAGRTECIKCHSDHLGRTFNIVKWETTAQEFDHRQAGYPLEGKHARLACNRCHQPKHIVEAERKLIRVRDLRRTYLGLTPKCGSCHEDVHKGKLGPDCARCHQGFQAWKPAAGFDHQTSRYPLTGMHAKVACEKCHKDHKEKEKAYKGIPFAVCTDCHKDPHRGAFKAACDSCHNTNGWKGSHLTLGPGFDHSQTKFPLKGLHGTKVGCVECHKTSNFKEPLAHERCADCHSKKDPHQGQFGRQDCAPCHGESGWKPALYTLSMHQKSAYPLAGRHADVKCEKCHLPAGPQTRYKIPFGACLDCHKDPHAGQFQKQTCESCHNVEGFRPSTYTLTRHQQSRFALKGGHAAVACVECHKSPAAGTPVRYHFDSLACEGCHRDPHGGRAQAKGQTCELCHNTRAWKEVSAFDHSATRFSLAGAHRAVACLECHRPSGPNRAERQIKFQDAATTCQGCHEDAHGGQFTTDCASCHNALAWKPTIFDHETRSIFSLAGAHREVPCGDCHNRKSERRGRLVVVYKGTPTRCRECHR